MKIGGLIDRAIEEHISCCYTSTLKDLENVGTGHLHDEVSAMSG